MNYSLYLAHINDTHSHFESTPIAVKLPLALSKSFNITVPCGGYPMIAAALDAQRLMAKVDNIPCVFLHAGDSFQGSLYFSRFKGMANARLLNKLLPDAMTIGNHEFDLGNKPLSQFIANAQFPLLAGNMDLHRESLNKELPLSSHDNLYSYNHHKKIANYLLKSLGDKQLAIVGITLDFMHKIGFPDHDCHFINAIETAQRTINYLHNQGIYHIIIVSHLGFQGDITLATEVNGISAIVGGHSHTLTGDFRPLGLESTEKNETIVNNTLILQAGKHAETIGLSQLNFDEYGQYTHQTGGIKLLVPSNWHTHPDNTWLTEGDITLCNQYFKHSRLIESHPPCSEIQSLIDQEYRPSIDAMKHNVICTLSKNYPHVRVPTDNCPLGSLVAPLVSEAFYQCANEYTQTDFGLHNAGGVRVSLDQGEITEAEICGRLLPFEINIISYKIKGKYLKLALEGAINNAQNNGVVGTGDGSYPYCYGLKYSYNANAPLSHRIENLCVQHQGHWQKIMDNKVYRGVSSAYTIAGKEGYDALLNSTDLFELPYSMSDAFILYLQSNQL